MRSDLSNAKAPRPAQGPGSLRVGRLTKPHGLKGGIKLELYTDNPELRFAPGETFQVQVPEQSPWFGRSVTIRELRWFNGVPVAFFDEVRDRTAAESIVRAILWIDESTALETVEENAWYHHQLVGLEVRRPAELGAVLLGTVAEVQHFPAQDLLAIKTARGQVLVPFVTEIVPSVDLDAGVVTVTPPTGLFEDVDQQPDDPASVDPSSEDPPSDDLPGDDPASEDLPGEARVGEAPSASDCSSAEPGSNLA